MYEIGTLIFTGVIAISTCIYSYYSAKLWKATLASVDIARYTTFMNYMTTLGQQIEQTKVTDPQGAAFLEQFAMLMGEFAIERFLEDVDFKKNAEVRDYFNKIEVMFRARNVDPQSIPWLRVVLKKLKE